MARATFWILLLTGGLAAALLFLPRYLSPPLLGQAFLGIVVLYNLLLFMGAWLRGQHELQSAFAFVLPLSLCQVVPDTLLVQVLGVLSFPDLGAPRFGPVPAYMAGLWVAPLLLVIWAAETLGRGRDSTLGGLLMALLASAAVFGASEWAAHIPALWFPRNVQTWHGVALYVVPAEALLGAAAWLMFRLTEHRTIFMKAAGAAAVSMFYAGALFASLLVVRRFI